jgi:hypothetical protein
MPALDSIKLHGAYSAAFFVRYSLASSASVSARAQICAKATPSSGECRLV